jgi:hypothetical protein
LVVIAILKCLRCLAEKTLNLFLEISWGWRRLVISRATGDARTLSCLPID